LIATTPPHAAGAVDVTATNGSASSTLTLGYTYGASAVPALPTSWLAALAGILGLAGLVANRRRAQSQGPRS
jgi:hypothetical protein